jgi:hypothetical protein
MQFYDIQTQFTSANLWAAVEHFSALCPPTNAGTLMAPKYITLSLPFLMFLFRRPRLVDLAEFVGAIIDFMNTHGIHRNYDWIYAKIYFFSLAGANPLPVLLGGYPRSSDLHFHQGPVTIVNCILKH